MGGIDDCRLGYRRVLPFRHGTGQIACQINTLNLTGSPFPETLGAMPLLVRFRPAGFRAGAENMCFANSLRAILHTVTTSQRARAAAER